MDWKQNANILENDEKYVSAGSKLKTLTVATFVSVYFFHVTPDNRAHSIYQNSDMQICLSIPKKDQGTNKTPPNIEICPESHGAMLEYW